MRLVSDDATISKVTISAVSGNHSFDIDAEQVLRGGMTAHQSHLM